MSRRFSSKCTQPRVVTMKCSKTSKTSSNCMMFLRPSTTESWISSFPPGPLIRALIPKRFSINLTFYRTSIYISWYYSNLEIIIIFKSFTTNTLQHKGVELLSCRHESGHMRAFEQRRLQSTPGFPAGQWGLSQSSGCAFFYESLGTRWHSLPPGRKSGFVVLHNEWVVGNHARWTNCRHLELVESSWTIE